MSPQSYTYHAPVMLQECMDSLAIKPNGTYVDVTFGGGGHSSHILSQLNEQGRLIAFDRDQDAAENTLVDSRFTLVPHDYRFIYQFLKYLNAIPVDGILADLGVSSWQLDAGSRGFSYRFDGPLDMRMDRQQSRSAAKILNEYPAAQLKLIFKTFAEIPQAAAIAEVIVAHRARSPFTNTFDLVEVIKPFAPRNDEYSFYSRIFQAIRIEVNDELGALSQFLEASSDCLATGGRLVVLTYHSLEDRLVKNIMKRGNLEGTEVKDIFGKTEKIYKTIGKDLTASQQELQNNPRSRSARLRVAEKMITNG